MRLSVFGQIAGTPNCIRVLRFVPAAMVLSLVHGLGPLKLEVFPPGLSSGEVFRSWVLQGWRKSVAPLAGSKTEAWGHHEHPPVAEHQTVLARSFRILTNARRRYVSLASWMKTATT